MKNSAEKYTVTIDTKDKDLLSLDKKGVHLDFDSSVKLFKKLSKKVLDGLGAENRQRYLLARGLFQVNIDEQESPAPTFGLEGYGRNASPRSRLHVDDDLKDPDFVYSWKRPDELRQVKVQGGQVVTSQTDPKMKSFAGKDGTHTVGVGGDVELVYTKFPKEVWRKIKIEEPEQKSKKHIGNVEKAAAAKMGGDAFIPGDKNRNLNWNELGTAD